MMMTMIMMMMMVMMIAITMMMKLLLLTARRIGMSAKNETPCRQNPEDQVTGCCLATRFSLSWLSWSWSGLLGLELWVSK